MINIKEYQWEKTGEETLFCLAIPQNYQQRVIEYSSWEDYCNDIVKVDGMKELPYPSLPRQTRINESSLCCTDKWISFDFVHRLLRKDIMHYAEPISDWWSLNGN